MALLQVNDLWIGFRGPTLLAGISCQIEAGQKIGLLGRNGAGKTTFMKLICGFEKPDNGEIVFAPGAKLAFLPQDVPRDLTGKVADIVSSGIGPGPHDSIEDWESEKFWKIPNRLEQILTEMQLPAEAAFESLSSGMKRRVLLARAIASSPDLLLLDEPTNHLDIDAIHWLEDFLGRWKGTLLFVTHDRMFLRKLSTRIIEIDRGKLFDWSCDYDSFLKRKEAAISAEEKQNALFDKKLAQEEVWIRTGIKARRTRNEGRVRALEKMRLQRSQRNSGAGNVQMQIQEGQRSGMKVADVEEVSFSYGDKPIFDNFSTTIMRGDKIGILGPNGAGKTTLLKVLLGKLEPQKGTVTLGTNLQIAYFDQLREQLNEEASVQDNVGDGYETIHLGGSSRHVIGYLQDFLFTPDRARTPVKFLSGGERNRVLLAKLFAKPANVIVLDEPTNDLDSETLELLEELLVQFEGTVLLVSHDREFLNHVVTSTIVYENGNIKEYFGGYDDWQRQRVVDAAAKAEKQSTSSSSGTSKKDDTKKRRLSYKEQQELAKIPALIEKIEGDIARLHDEMASPNFYQKAGDFIAKRKDELSTLEQKLASTVVRWELLESMSE